ncbi:NAD(P)H-dependent oxidoreductase subunit E, partial [Xanthomonas citri pv. citri]
VILHALQEAFGYVPEAAVPMVAQALNLSRAEVHGVVTFYHDFRHKPAGRHVLKLCRAEACQAAGGDALAARAEAKLGVPLGNTTADDRVTSRWSRSTASACARPRRPRCSMAASLAASTRSASMRWLRRRSDEHASIRLTRCRRNCRRRRR